jgi:peptidoglycan/xylan/chitin deacetylase (PgdA/CDA1 family)
VHPDTSDPYAVAPEEFAWQLEELVREGFEVVSLAELEEMLRTKSVRSRTVVITFDDGRKDNVGYALPVLSRLGLPAAIFSITGSVGKEFSASHGSVLALSEEEMRQMHASGLIDFEPHGVSHAKLTALTPEEAHREITDSKRFLEELLRKSCSYFAYPKGRWNRDVAGMAHEAGIRLAFAMGGGVVTSAADPLALPRNDIKADTTRAMFKGVLAHGAIR